MMLWILKAATYGVPGMDFLPMHCGRVERYILTYQYSNSGITL